MIFSKERLLESLIAGVAVWISISIISKKKTEKRKLVGKVTGIFNHPLKSGKPNSHENAFAGAMGLVKDNLLDRSIAVRREKSNLKISGREAPTLTQITTKNIDGKIIMSAPGMSDLNFEFPTLKSETNIQIFGEIIEGTDGGDEAAQWISIYLKTPSRLTILPKNRFLQAKSDTRNWRLDGIAEDKNVASFQDGYPYLLLSDQSLQDVNHKIPAKDYTHRTFRPNITIDNESGKPWHEDNFVGELHIGNAIFAVASPCPRCIFTTVDPFTSKRSPDMEPLISLRKTRLVQGKDAALKNEQYKNTPTVGVNLVIIKEGEIKVGDEVILIN